MRFIRLLAVLGFVLASIPARAVDLGWDGYVAVPAFNVGPGVWLTCPPGELLRASKSTSPKCVKKGFFFDTPTSNASPTSIADLLARHFQPPTGFAAVAVGPLPVITVGPNQNDYDETRVLIAYRLVPQR